VGIVTGFFFGGVGVLFCCCFAFFPIFSVQKYTVFFAKGEKKTGYSGMKKKLCVSVTA
jgi:hypothetical protein